MNAVARFSAAVSLLVLVAGCEPDRQMGPDAALFARGGASASTAPSNLVATALAHDQISLGWKDNTTNEDGFEVQWSTTGAAGVFSPYTTLGANVTAVTIGGLTGATQYCFRVASFIVRGRKTTYSSFSNTSCATTSPTPVPAAPTATTATPSYGSAVTVTWNAAVGAQYQFNIERSVAAGPFAVVGSVSDDQRQWSDWSPTIDATLCYRVIAFNGYGGSSPSAPDCTAIPSAPSGLTATASGPQSIDLAWTSTSPVEDGFEVQRYNRDGSITTTALPANTLAYQDGGLSPDTWYIYAVYATKDGGYSSISNQVEVSTSAAAAPNPPAYVFGRPLNSSSTVVEWNKASPSTTSYRVDRSSDGELSWTAVALSTADTSFFDNGITTDQVVCYRVYATNGFGESGPSASSCTAAPAAPTNVHTEPLDDSYYTAAWTDNSNVEDGYYVWTYYYYDYGWGLEYNEYAYWLPANSTSVALNVWETLNFVVATRDGGWSDLAYAASAGASRTAESATLRKLRRGDGAGRASRPLPGPAPKTKPQPKRSGH